MVEMAWAGTGLEDGFGGVDGFRWRGGGVAVARKLAFVAVEGVVHGLHFDVNAGDVLQKQGEIDLFFLAVFFDGEVGFVLGADFGGVTDVVAEGVEER